MNRERKDKVERRKKENRKERRRNKIGKGEKRGREGRHLPIYYNDTSEAPGLIFLHDIVSLGSEVKILFTTDGSVQRSGFKLTFEDIAEYGGRFCSLNN